MLKEIVEKVQNEGLPSMPVSKVTLYADGEEVLFDDSDDVFLLLNKFKDEVKNAKIKDLVKWLKKQENSANKQIIQELIKDIEEQTDGSEKVEIR